MNGMKTTKRNYILDYWQEIESGRIIVSKKVKQQMLKLVKLLKETKEDGCRWSFDIDKANRPISFIEKFCRHVKGELTGKPIKLELWQKAIVQALYGFVDRLTCYRKHRKLHLFVGRKNGKTIFAACLIIYNMVADGELGAECYSIATKRDQAKIVWDMARLIVLRSPALSQKLHITVNGIYLKPYRDTLFQPLSKESKKLDGANAQTYVVDELHAITDKNQIDVLWDSTKARRQPIELITTTMGTVRSSAFDDIYEYDANVLADVFEDERLLVFCYELDSESEYTDQACWYKANPNLGISYSIESLKEDVQRAINDTKNLVNLLCKSFNIRKNNVNTWLDFEDVHNETIYDLNQFDNTYVLGGLDLSRTGDMTAFTTLYFDKVNKKVVAETMYWITKKYLESAKDVPFNTWIANGYVRVSGGDTNLIDYKDISSYIFEKFQSKGIMYQHINYDSYSASYLINELVSFGYSANRCLIPTQQGYKTLSIPMQTLEAHIKDKTLCYQNNPVTKWNMLNVELEQDRNGNFMPTKSGGRKIDGFATILNAYVSLCNNIDYYLN